MLSILKISMNFQANYMIGIIFYLESGVIMVNPAINDGLKISAKKLIKLVGLDRRPGHPSYSNKDKRCQANIS